MAVNSSDSMSRLYRCSNSHRILESSSGFAFTVRTARACDWFSINLEFIRNSAWAGTFDEFREAVLLLVSGLSNRPSSEWRKIRCVIR